MLTKESIKDIRQHGMRLHKANRRICNQATKHLTICIPNETVIIYSVFELLARKLFGYRILLIVFFFMVYLRRVLLFSCSVRMMTTITHSPSFTFYITTVTFVRMMTFVLSLSPIIRMLKKIM